VKLLRAYLLVRRNAGDWEVTLHSDLDTLREAWRPFQGTQATGLIHIGFWRPDTEAFEHVAMHWPGLILLTSPARYSLPQPCPVAQRGVGEVDGMTVYVALEGWGYEVTLDQLGLGESAREVPTESDSGSEPREQVANPQDWVASIVRNSPDLAEELRAWRVVDEASYLKAESEMPAAIRGRLGMQRFVYFAKGPCHPASILDNLRFAPPWLLALPTTALNLSVRSSNCLGTNAVTTLKDLAKFGEESLLRIANLGRKSVHEIGEEVARVFVEGPFDPAVRPNHLGRRAAENGLVDDSDIGGTTRVQYAVIRASLENALVRGLNLFDDQHVKLMWLRMGFDGKPRTLQEIGDEFGLTRERIRQIENKCVNRLVRLPIWKDELEERLSELLRDRPDPLPLLGLEILDPWFAGAERFERPLEYALDRFCAKPFSLVRIRGQIFVSQIGQIAWDNAVKEGRRILEAEVGRNLRESEAHAVVDALLVGAGEELRPELWTEAARWAHFATSDRNNGERILVSFGHGAENIVEAVLMESDRPLHYTEIAKQCTQRLGRSIEVRRAHQSAANVGLLFGRGTFGMIKHFPLDDSERRVLVAEAEDLIEGGEFGKQWHAKEIAESLEERGLDFGGALTPYIVSIALESSRTLAYLGRMVWVSRSTGARGSANRIDVHQAVVSLLILAGQPMQSDEIRERIAKDRGLSGVFQIQPEGPIVRIGAGLWGLTNRDLPFSEVVAATVVNGMVDILRKTGKGLHISEIQSALKSFVPQVVTVLDPALFLGLAQKSEILAVAKGQYVFLAEWHESRRLTGIEAVKRALLEAGPLGLTLDDGLKAVEALLERPFSRPTFSNYCQNVGARYDEATAKWSLMPEQATPEDETSDTATA